MTFNTKLVGSFTLILVVTVLSMGIVANILLNTSAHNLGTNLSSGLVGSTIRALDIKVKAQDELVRLGMLGLENEFAAGTAPEQIVKALLAEHKLYATVFEKRGEDFVRIATTIPTKGGGSAIGTKLDTNSDAYRAVASGGTWHGARVLMGFQSIVQYKAYGPDIVLYVGLPIIDDDFVTYLKNLNVNSLGYMYLFTGEGKFAWHPNNALSGKSFADASYASALLGANNELISYTFNDELKYAYVGIHEESGLRVGFGLTGNEIKFGLDKDILTSGLIGSAAALIVSSIVVFLVVANIRKVLKGVEVMARNVADGNYDERVDYEVQDNIRAMLDALEAMAAQIKQQIEDVRARSEEAMKAKAEAEAALESVREAQAEIEAKNEKIQSAAREARSVAETMSSTATELSAQVEQVSQGAENQKNRVSEVATAIEEMSATVIEVARNAGDTSSQAEDSKSMATNGMEIMGQTIEAIGNIREIDEVSNIAMQDLSDKADAVGGIIGVIQDIADQTNLLALNAAIEAARAGDAGRGFAVVADEVRKLAEKTMQATQEVGDSISKIQSAVGKNVKERARAQEALELTVNSAQQVNGILDQIVESITRSADMANGIATATEEQSAATEEITASVEEVDRISGETTDAMRESSKAVHDLAQLAEDLTVIIQSLTED
ncbi:methyl-accepting chemotaxis protein [Desulfocurvus sp. DL9XJH121]